MYPVNTPEVQAIVDELHRLEQVGQGDLGRVSKLLIARQVLAVLNLEGRN